jgi:tartrate dehydratase alpha subunit/fumarate hydratase class I-like protein
MLILATQAIAIAKGCPSCQDTPLPGVEVLHGACAWQRGACIQRIIHVLGSYMAIAAIEAPTWHLLHDRL